MDTLSLSESMSNSIKPEVSSVIAELGEIGLDSLMDDGILKEIPIISTAVAAYNIGNTIRERHSVAKLYAFIQAINEGIMSDTQRESYIDDFIKNDKQRNSELQYLMIILDRYVDFDKPRALAKIYLAYLKKQISWLDVRKYAETIDRFLAGDIEVLKSQKYFNTQDNIITDSLQRLVAMGLIIEERPKPSVKSDVRGEIIVDRLALHKQNRREYSITKYGKKLIEILNNTSE